ncbi:hypothetical protein ACU4GA_28105 [Methylobacterium oryzae CBMB20]
MAEGADALAQALTEALAEVARRVADASLAPGRGAGPLIPWG